MLPWAPRFSNSAYWKRFSPSGKWRYTETQTKKNSKPCPTMRCPPTPRIRKARPTPSHPPKGISLSLSRSVCPLADAATAPTHLPLFGDLAAAVDLRRPLLRIRLGQWRGCTGSRPSFRWESSAACSASWATPSISSTRPRTAGYAQVPPLSIRILLRVDARCWFYSVCMQPKHIGNDMWDVAMERRDKKLMEQSSGN